MKIAGIMLSIPEKGFLLLFLPVVFCTCWSSQNFEITCTRIIFEFQMSNLFVFELIFNVAICGYSEIVHFFERNLQTINILRYN